MELGLSAKSAWFLQAVKNSFFPCSHPIGLEGRAQESSKPKIKLLQTCRVHMDREERGVTGDDTTDRALRLRTRTFAC